jgi:hypothetical protein
VATALNVPAAAILQPTEAPALARPKPTIVAPETSLDAFDLPLLALQPTGFTGRDRAVLDARSDPLPLPPLAVLHVGFRRRGPREQHEDCKRGASAPISA